MSAPSAGQPGSSSLHRDGYWWHRARADLLGAVMGPHLGAPRRSLDVGSADAPSVGWMQGAHQHVSLDLFPDGLVPGQGVVGSATELPFADGTFDVVSAFDVVEHCADDARAVSELVRVLAPGGRLLLSVPAYQWAWSDHDVQAGHHRRYTRAELVGCLENARIQTRMLFAGNVVQQPMFDEMRASGAGYRVSGPLTVTDRLMRGAVLVGCYPGLSGEQIDYIGECINSFVAGAKRRRGSR